jgi:hypothetical protein
VGTEAPTVASALGVFLTSPRGCRKADLRGEVVVDGVAVDVPFDSGEMCQSSADLVGSYQKVVLKSVG